jgi:hypothetical protein
MEDWTYNKTLSGCPQGGILSPLLSNIYLNKLDLYVENELIPKYSRGKKRAENKQYKKIYRQVRKNERLEDWREAKKCRKQLRKTSAGVSSDETFRRLRYIRYADDWLIGFIGSKKEAEIVKVEISEYLRVELKLQLNQEKTFITNARKGTARFLGYDVHTAHNDAKLSNGFRALNGTISLRVPRDKLQAKKNLYMVNGKPVHRTEWTINSEFDIISRYQSEYRGFAQYYLHAYNVRRVNSVKWIMERSLVKTLACKHQMSMKQVYRKYQTTVSTIEGTYKVLQVKIERDDKNPLIAYFGGVSLKYNKSARIADGFMNGSRQVFSDRSQLVDRLTRNVCELCGSSVDVEMHHVRKLKDLKSGRGVKPMWMQKMIAINRKTLAVCIDCHCRIHSGRYDGVRVH